MTRLAAAEDRKEAHDLAVAFIAETAGETGPWRALFEGWADEHKVPPAKRRAVVVALIRVRCFG